MENKKYKIGVDVSGGDHAPSEIIKGAIWAGKELEDDIVLIGVKEEIEREIEVNKGDIKRFTIVHAPEKIEMGESPATSVRRKRNSSIVIGTELLEKKEIDAFVSCGNTGAAVCSSTLSLRLIEGIERPGIALTIPNQKNRVSVMIDVGANVNPKPLQLFQYGIMASVYYSLLFNIPNPTVGLLNIGEEESKGPDYMKDVHHLFSISPLNFIGNVEPKDIFAGNCDCIVCDGFVGNVALKVMEASAKFVGKYFLEILNRDLFSKLKLLLLKNEFLEFKKRLDYAEYGGAPLLGVPAVVMIGHGRSNDRAVKNAIKAAVHELRRDLIEQIKRRVNEICQDSRVRKILAPEDRNKL